MDLGESLKFIQKRGLRWLECLVCIAQPRRTDPGKSTAHAVVPKTGKMEDSVVEMLAWLFEKTEDEIVEEAEVAALNSMLLADDPRPERAA